MGKSLAGDESFDNAIQYLNEVLKVFDERRFHVAACYVSMALDELSASHVVQRHSAAIKPAVARNQHWGDFADLPTAG